jgi:hypothetical protein
MQALKTELTQQTGATVYVEALDLAQSGSAAELLKRLNERGLVRDPRMQRFCLARCETSLSSGRDRGNWGSWETGVRYVTWIR